VLLGPFIHSPQITFQSMTPQRERPEVVPTRTSFYRSQRLRKIHQCLMKSNLSTKTHILRMTFDPKSQRDTQHKTKGVVPFRCFCRFEPNRVIIRNMFLRKFNSFLGTKLPLDSRQDKVLSFLDILFSHIYKRLKTPPPESFLNRNRFRLCVCMLSLSLFLFVC